MRTYGSLFNTALATLVALFGIVLASGIPAPRATAELRLMAATPDEFGVRGHALPAILCGGASSHLALAGVRWAFPSTFGETVTYLQFLPAIIVASWSGASAPASSRRSAAAWPRSITSCPPDGFALPSAADAGSLAIFTSIGLVIGTLNGRLREAHESTRRESELATTRAERLSTVINTTVDGIIVIDGRRRIEAFNRGAQRLFDIPKSRGTGLGLPTSKRFIDAHDGRISIDCPPSCGTTVTIQLPSS